MPDLSGSVMDPTTYEHQMVLVTNEDARPLHLMFHGNRYKLEPNVTQPVPYLAMVLWFGNPRTFDSLENPDRNFRARERERLSSKWGVGFDRWYEDPTALAPGETPRSSSFYAGMDPTSPYTEELILGRRQFMHPNLPRVRVETWDHKRLITVIDDPFGVHSGGRDPSEGDTKGMVDDMMRQLEANRQQQLLMLQVIRDLNPDQAGKIEHLFTGDPAKVTAEGLPVWNEDAPGIVLPDGTATITPTTATPATNALGDDSGLTDAIASDPVPTKRVTRPSK